MLGSRTSQAMFHFVKKQTHISFRKLVELELFVLSVIQNYDLKKHYKLILSILMNVSGSNRQKIRTLIQFRFNFS